MLPESRQPLFTPEAPAHFRNLALLHAAMKSVVQAAGRLSLLELVETPETCLSPAAGTGRDCE